MSAAIPRHQRAFWEKMATKYPLPFDEKSLADTIRLIELVEARGVQIDGASILDIGCCPSGQPRCWDRIFFKAWLTALNGNGRSMALPTPLSCAAHETSWISPVAQGLEKGFDIA